MRVVPLVLGALLAAGCITVTWQRESRFTPPPARAVGTLRPGECDLDRCLAALGAPLWVWEYQGDGVALAYGWLEEKGWNLDVSLPVAETYSLSFDYNDRTSEMQGLVLLFDEELTLRDLRRGLLRDLTTAAGRARPAPLPDQP